MSTASTKRARKRGPTPPAAAKKKGTESESGGGAGVRSVGPEDLSAAPPAEVSERAWLVLSLCIIAAATLLRLYALELKPMHHDEGVNGFFLTNLVRQGVYKYDPTNYHGPTLYYLTLPAVALFGLTTFATRLVVALFGVGAVWLVLSLRRRLGATGALAAAALLAVSPGAVFYSRYFIHETLFVFFTLGVVVAALRFYEGGGARYLLLASASAAMLFATKETAFISLGTLALAALVAWGWARLAGGAKAQAPAQSSRKRRAGKGVAVEEPGVWATLRSRFGGRERAASLVAASVALFLLINLLFYSSFFTNWQGVGGAVEALKVWTKTGTSEFHKKPPQTYLGWLWQEEAPIFILATVGAVAALFERRKNRFAIFAGAWGFGLLVAYSLIPYKTPWLMLSFVAPLALAGGYAVRALARLNPWAAGLVLLWAAAGGVGVEVLRRAAEQPAAWSPWLSWLSLAWWAGLVVLTMVATIQWRADETSDGGENGAAVRRTLAHSAAAAALAVCAYQSMVLNFRQYDNDRYPYVYAHTQREVLAMLGEIDKLAARAGTRQPGISITFPNDYWPLPWYFRDNTRVAYLSDVAPTFDPNTTHIVIGKDTQLPQLQRATGDKYEQVGVYPLRPAVRLVLFARRDLAGD